MAAMVGVTSDCREEDEEDCWDEEAPWAMILPPRGMPTTV